MWLELREAVRTFGERRALDGVSFELEEGQIGCLLGPSGCGKTTLLRILAGFEHPDSGRVLLDGEDITPLPPNRRKVNTVFQSYALFPHLSVHENVAFGLRVARRPRHEIDVEVHRMLALVQMEGSRGVWPSRASTALSMSCLKMARSWFS